MSELLSESIKLYGTEEPVVERQILNAGALTAEFDQGALRFIKINGIEAIRNIGYVVRDKDWGTYAPAITNLKIDQQANSFSITFDAVCKDDNQEMQYSISVEGKEDGSLKFSSSAKTITDFLTNRIGFVVLHPIVGVSGVPVEIEHTDGSIDNSEFPVLVDPVQPFMDIRAMTHEIAPGVSVACRMEGDIFETEDHRQWNDASYKTYSRPIAIPYPYTVAAGDEFDQSVTLTVQGELQPKVDASSGSCEIEITESDHLIPPIGLGVEPQHLRSAIDNAELTKSLGTKFIICWHDLRAEHGTNELKLARQLAEKTNTQLVLEAVLPCVDYRAELAEIAQQVSDADVEFAAVSFSPADYLLSITPGSAWPDVPALEDIYDHARELFPGKTLGGGMFAFFPELNRYRPPLGHLDYITHTSNTITHACDDITVTENLEALPYVFNTCRSFAGGKPYRLGPSSIGMRFNPYGSKTMDNPDNKRIAMARMEPRQRGLLNAAWTIGYLAHAIRGEIDAVAMHAPTGEFGLIYTEQNWAQPGFDGTQRKVYPAYHALRGVASAAGNKSLVVSSTNSHDVEALGYTVNGKRELWIANLTSLTQSIKLQNFSSSAQSIRRLNTDTFDACTKDATHFTQSGTSFNDDKLTLSAYEVVQLLEI